MTSEGNPVMIALDGSKNAENAIPMGVFLANAYGRQLHLIHVVTDSERKKDDNPDEATHFFERYCRDLMMHYCVNQGYRATSMHGDAAENIVRISEQADAKVLVVATHGHGGLRALVLGSVADKVCRTATVPVVVVPSIGEAVVPGDGPVVVGLDGTNNSLFALSAARRLAAKLRATTILVRACQSTVIVGPEFAYFPPNVTSDVEASARAYLELIARPSEVLEVRRGLPAEALNDVATEHDASFIVVASHGKGIGKRLAFGSVTNDLLHSITRPVVVVPPRDC